MNIPRPLRWLYDRWMDFSHVLGLIMSRILLSVLWIILFGPYAIIWKLTHMRNDHGKNSYWIDVAPETPGGMHHPF